MIACDTYFELKYFFVIIIKITNIVFDTELLLRKKMQVKSGLSANLTALLCDISINQLELIMLIDSNSPKKK